MRSFALVSLLCLVVSICACGQEGDNSKLTESTNSDDSYPFGLNKAYQTAIIEQENYQTR